MHREESKEEQIVIVELDPVARLRLAAEQFKSLTINAKQH